MQKIDIVIKSNDPILWDDKFNVESATILKKNAKHEKEQRDYLDKIANPPETQEY
jgi:hypothetical protein